MDIFATGFVSTEIGLAQLQTHVKKLISVKNSFSNFAPT
jgi:hypothetical protein